MSSPGPVSLHMQIAESGTRRGPCPHRKTPLLNRLAHDRIRLLTGVRADESYATRPSEIPERARIGLGCRDRRCVSGG